MVTRLLTGHRISLFGRCKICRRGFLLKSIFAELSEWFQLRVPLCMSTCVAWLTILRLYLLKFTPELPVRFKKICAGAFYARTRYFCWRRYAFFNFSSPPGFQACQYLLFWRDINSLIIFENGTNLALLTGSSSNLRSNRKPVTNPIDNATLSTSFSANVPVDVLNRPFAANRGCPPFDSHLSFRSCEEISTDAVACVSH